MYLSLSRSIDAAYLRAHPGIEAVLQANAGAPKLAFYMERLAYVFSRLCYHDSPFLLGYLAASKSDRFGGVLALHGSSLFNGPEHPATKNLERITGMTLESIYSE
jgi:hypothetical protein